MEKASPGQPKLLLHWDEYRARAIVGADLTTASIDDQRPDQSINDIRRVVNSGRAYFDAGWAAVSWHGTGSRSKRRTGSARPSTRARTTYRRPMIYTLSAPAAHCGASRFAQPGGAGSRKQVAIPAKEALQRQA